MGWAEIQPVDVDVAHLAAEHRAACDEIHELRALLREIADFTLTDDLHAVDSDCPCKHIHARLNAHRPTSVTRKDQPTQ